MKILQIKTDRTTVNEIHRGKLKQKPLMFKPEALLKTKPNITTYKVENVDGRKE